MKQNTNLRKNFTKTSISVVCASLLFIGSGAFGTIKDNIITAGNETLGNSGQEMKKPGNLDKSYIYGIGFENNTHGGFGKQPSIINIGKVTNNYNFNAAANERWLAGVGSVNARGYVLDIGFLGFNSYIKGGNPDKHYVNVASFTNNGKIQALGLSDAYRRGNNVTDVTPFVHYGAYIGTFTNNGEINYIQGHLDKNSVYHKTINFQGETNMQIERFINGANGKIQDSGTDTGLRKGVYLTSVKELENSGIITSDFVIMRNNGNPLKITNSGKIKNLALKEGDIGDFINNGEVGTIKLMDIYNLNSNTRGKIAKYIHGANATITDKIYAQTIETLENSGDLDFAKLDLDSNAKITTIDNKGTKTLSGTSNYEIGTLKNTNSASVNAESNGTIGRIENNTTGDFKLISNAKITGKVENAGSGDFDLTNKGGIDGAVTSTSSGNFKLINEGGVGGAISDTGSKEFYLKNTTGSVGGAISSSSKGNFTLINEGVSTKNITYTNATGEATITNISSDIRGAINITAKNATITNTTNNATIGKGIVLDTTNAKITNQGIIDGGIIINATNEAKITNGVDGGGASPIANGGAQPPQQPQQPQQPLQNNVIKGGVHLESGNLEIVNARDSAFMVKAEAVGTRYHIKHDAGAGNIKINNWNFDKENNKQRIIISSDDLSKVTITGNFYGDAELFKQNSYVQYLVLTPEQEAKYQNQINGEMRMKDPNKDGTTDIAGNHINGGTNKFSDAFQGGDSAQAKLFIAGGGGGLLDEKTPLYVHHTGLIGKPKTIDNPPSSTVLPTVINSFGARLITSQNTLKEISIKNFKTQKQAQLDDDTQERLTKAKAYQQAQMQEDSYIAQGYENTYDLYAQAGDSGALIYNEALRGYTDKDLLHSLDDIFIKQNKDYGNVYSFALPYFNLTRDASSGQGTTISKSQGIMIGAQGNTPFGTLGVFGSFEGANRENNSVRTDIDEKSFTAGVTYYNAFHRFDNKELFANLGASVGETRTDLHLIDSDDFSSQTKFNTLVYSVDFRFGGNVYDILTNSMVTPELGVIYTGLKTNPFVISHKSLSENYETTKTNLIEGLVGIRYHKAGSQTTRFSMATGAKIRLYDDAQSHLRLKGVVDEYKVLDISLPNSFFYVQMGYTKLIGENAEISFNYQANFAKEIQSHTGFVRLGYWW